MRPVADPTGLSLLFHLNSEPWLNDRAYESAGRHEQLRRVDEEAPGIQLPAPAPSPLGRLIEGRASCRAFAPVTMPLAVAGELLAAAQGVVGTMDLGGGGALVRRSAPSAGGLYPLDVYAWCQRVEGLADGLYRYDPFGHGLAPLRPGSDVDALEAGLYAYPFVRDANVVLALASTFARTQSKYGPRGYRYILLEAGHAAQNACLRATELGLATLCIGGFVDSVVNALLGLEPERGGIVYMLGAGTPTESGQERGPAPTVPST
jgi:SagB-type dehydrogenase family enzyme